MVEGRARFQSARWVVVLGRVTTALFVLGSLLHRDSREWVARPLPRARGRARAGGSPGTAGMPHDHRCRHVQRTEEPP